MAAEKIPAFKTEEERNNWIMDLYNSKKKYYVWTKNSGDTDDCFEWLQISMGIVVCFCSRLIEITHYHLR